MFCLKVYGALYKPKRDRSSDFKPHTFCDIIRTMFFLDVLRVCRYALTMLATHLYWEFLDPSWLLRKWLLQAL